MVMTASPSPTSTATRRGGITSAPRIVANRRQLDDRFPSLGFTVGTGGLPFFEVLLATDATLFDPPNAPKRAAANFYSSRLTSGLIPAAEAAYPFLVPSAVLRGFAGAVPHPSAIYYTLIAYETADGTGPAFAHPPAALPAGAPSVAISRDFTGHTLATVLAISVDKLARHGGSLGDPVAPSPGEDAAEGEDGFGAPAVASQPPSTAASFQPSSTYQDQPQRYDPYGAHRGHVGVAGQDLGLDDGFELALLPGSDVAPAPPKHTRSTPPDPLLPNQPQASPSGSPEMLGYAQGSQFEAGEEEPDYLADDEDGRDYTDGAASLGTAESRRQHNGSVRAPESNGHGYNLSPDDLDLHPTRFQSLDEPVAAAELTPDDKMRIIGYVAPFESGGDYGAANPDGEFEGHFGTGHPACHTYHVGLSYGWIQFTQDSGKLGELLRMMQARDPDAFSQTFGPASAELIQTTNAGGPPSSQSPGGRSARVQPVAGADLWQEPWLARFRAAGQNPRFQAAQRELAATGYLDPMLPFAGFLGLDSERALAILVDRSIQMGVHGAKRWIISAVGPLEAEAVRRQALAALGHADLRSFQVATPGLAVDGEWGPETHAAMVAALRALGPNSPVPVPTPDQMISAMVRRAAPEAWRARIDKLHAAGIPDRHFRL